VKVNTQIEELATNRNQNPGFESYLKKSVFFFPSITAWD